MKIFPAIDLAGGRVVRLWKGRFDRETVYDHDPAAVARRFQAAGARRLHVIDLDGTRRAKSLQVDAIEALATVGLPVQVGGGIRSIDDAKRLFDCGAGAVVIGSLAVRDPRLTRTLLELFGGERVVLALDCRVGADAVPRVLTEGWAVEESVSVAELLASYADAGVRRILCTDIERDGTLEGPNVSLYRGLAADFPEVELLASGGVRDLEHLAQLAAAGCAGVIIGRSLYEATLSLEQALAHEEAPC